MGVFAYTDVRADHRLALHAIFVGEHLLFVAFVCEFFPNSLVVAIENWNWKLTCKYEPETPLQTTAPYSTAHTTMIIAAMWHNQCEKDVEHLKYNMLLKLFLYPHSVYGRFSSIRLPFRCIRRPHRQSRLLARVLSSRPTVSYPRPPALYLLLLVLSI